MSKWGEVYEVLRSSPYELRSAFSAVSDGAQKIDAGYCLDAPSWLPAGSTQKPSLMLHDYLPRVKR